MSKSSVTIIDYLRIIFRRKLALLIPLGAAITLLIPLWLVFPPKYRAEALVKRQDLAIVNSAPATLISRETSGVSLNTLRVEILTWDRLVGVMKLLHMDADINSAADRQKKCDELRDSIKIELAAQNRGTDLVKIAAVSNSKLLAQQIANAIADSYVEESKKAGNQTTEQAVEFLGTGADDTLAKLRDVEVELDKFRKERFAELPEVKKGILEQRLSLHTQQTARSLQLSAAQSRLTEIEKQIKDVPPRISAPPGEKEESAALLAGKNPSVTEDAQKAANLRQTLETLLANYTEDHPDVKRLRQELAALEHPQPAADTATHERMIINPAFQQLVMDGLSVRQEIKGCEAALRQVQAEITAREEELRQVVNEEKGYMDLLRKQKELETTYDQYRQSLLAAETLHRATTGKYGTQVEMIQRAIEPAKPYRLPRLELAGACVLGGLAIGIALVFLADYFDPSLQSAHEAAAFLNADVPVGGEIPILGKISVIPEPEAVRRRRRKVWAVVIVSALLAVGLVILALLSMERIWPERFENLMALIRRVLK